MPPLLELLPRQNRSWAEGQLARAPRALFGLAGGGVYTDASGIYPRCGRRRRVGIAANALSDAVGECATRGRERMDRDGARALRGRVDAALLEQLLADDFLGRPPPKSTGRDRYGALQAEALHREWCGQGGAEDDHRLRQHDRAPLPRRERVPAGDVTVR